MQPTRAALAEFVGTFALMFIGGAAIIVTGGGNLVAIALAHGFILAVMVSATLHISGGQFNPAVSIALAATQRQPWSQAAVFIASQLAGSIAAALLLGALLTGGPYDPQAVNIGATLGALTNPEDGQTALPLAAFGLEVIATFMLMFVIMGVAVDNRGVGRAPTVAGLAIGGCVAALIFGIGPATGASMNPARSLGPALAAGAWDHHWLYWIGPIIGAGIAAFAYKLVIQLDDEKT